MAEEHVGAMYDMLKALPKRDRPQKPGAYRNCGYCGVLSHKTEDIHKDGCYWASVQTLLAQIDGETG